MERELVAQSTRVGKCRCDDEPVAGWLRSERVPSRAGIMCGLGDADK